MVDAEEIGRGGEGLVKDVKEGERKKKKKREVLSGCLPGRLVGWLVGWLDC